MKQPKELVDLIIESIQEKKGKDILKLDMKGLGNHFCDYFVICDGLSNTQVDTIAQFIEENLKNTKAQNALSVTGRTNSQWILLDYGEVVVHVFQKTVREYYNLESLWADAQSTRYANL